MISTKKCQEMEKEWFEISSEDMETHHEKDDSAFRMRQLEVMQKAKHLQHKFITEFFSALNSEEAKMEASSYFLGREANRIDEVIHANKRCEAVQLGPKNANIPLFLLQEILECLNYAEHAATLAETKDAKVTMEHFLKKGEFFLAESGNVWNAMHIVECEGIEIAHKSDYFEGFNISEDRLVK